MLLCLLGTGPRMHEGRSAQTNRSKGLGRGRSKTPPAWRSDQCDNSRILVERLIKPSILSRLRARRRRHFGSGRADEVRRLATSGEILGDQFCDGDRATYLPWSVENLSHIIGGSNGRSWSDGVGEAVRDASEKKILQVVLVSPQHTGTTNEQQHLNFERQIGTMLSRVPTSELRCPMCVPMSAIDFPWQPHGLASMPSHRQPMAGNLLAHILGNLGMRCQSLDCVPACMFKRAPRLGKHVHTSAHQCPMISGTGNGKRLPIDLPAKIN
ncbi:hypothetical protein Acr_07g0006500 [Actinidia rufa]|uniref:Uncharacterized protein n=1 Tax=Actinidia rufa TaxID=165716 RepID=A0A7J0EVL6_9ERIC|nr:hypothetical protein Acr_07g0006500 [Actinidia rufa]